MNPTEDFEFSLSKTNRVRPKDINKLSFPEFIKNNSSEKVDEFINNISKEDFESNRSFDVSAEENKLLKTYQYLTQYMMHSIKHLKGKNEIMSNLITQQSEQNHIADNFLKKQEKKIKDIELKNQTMTENNSSIEFLLNTLNLQNIVNKVSQPSDYSQFNKMRQEGQELMSNPINDKELENIEGEIIANINEKINANNFKYNDNTYNMSQYQMDFEDNQLQNNNSEMNNLEMEMGMEDLDDNYSQNYEENDIEISNNKNE